MTVITKPISEKKIEALGQPLVAAEILPHRDVETGGVQGQDPLTMVLRARERRASSITTACLLLLALLVMCCGILGGFFLYNQYAYSQKLHLKGACLIPMMEDGSRSRAEAQYLPEDFDINADSDNYEKITVPTFEGGRSSRFIHDFNANKTGIIDVEARRCFVMPLNRAQVLPPKDLIDLILKMWQGYYDVDTKSVKETMRVVRPPLRDPSAVGMYIQHECDGWPIYKLEKYVSGVVKRSVSNDFVYMYFSGKNYLHLEIVDHEESIES